MSNLELLKMSIDKFILETKLKSCQDERKQVIQQAEYEELKREAVILSHLLQTNRFALELLSENFGFSKAYEQFVDKLAANVDVKKLQQLTDVIKSYSVHKDLAKTMDLVTRMMVIIRD